MPVVLKNMMEYIVVEKIKSMSDVLDCCLCEKCMGDIAAYALNRIPPVYVSSLEGELICKINALTPQLHSDIVGAITQAAKVVSANPKHCINVASLK